jgi:hypothetical protein
MFACRHPSSEVSTRHAAKTTRNPAAAFGDRWPRLILEHRVIGAHPRPNLVAIIVVGCSTIFRQVALAVAGNDALSGHARLNTVPGRTCLYDRAWTRWPTDPKKGTFGVLRGSLPH